MIEDMQTGVMQSNQNSSVSQPLMLKRSSTNLQPEAERNKVNIHAGVTGKQNRRTHRNQRQSKRENAKVLKKPQLQGFYSKEPVGKKCGNGNLLNFHYTSPRGKIQRRRRPTFNKETFLQANCKFVVDWDNEKYREQTIDPDVLVDWDVIQLVYLPTHENPKCPICLYPPSAAKMTRCGHVYCWSCVIHYLSLGDKTWRKCPICHESVHEKDLKSVIPIIQKKFSRIDNITMKLMRRSKDSLCAVPYAEWNPSKTQFPTWEGQPFSSSSSKLLLATSEYVFENILKREKLELTAQLHECLQENSGEEFYVEMALKKLEEKLAIYDECKATTERTISDETSEIVAEPTSLITADNGLSIMLNSEKGEHANAFSDEDDENSVVKIVASVELTTNPSHESNHSRIFTSQNERSSSSSDDTEVLTDNEDVYEAIERLSEECYFFYQAEDGQNIFINSLNARCLIEEYGSLGEGPQKIVGQILDFECYTMTHELRKRFRYLSHLPLSCEFIICELMLRPPILSRQTIHNFMPEFKKRKAMRLKKTEEQRIFDMRAQAEQSKQAGYRVSSDYCPEVSIDLSNVVDFPSSISPDEGLMSVTHQKDQDQIKGPSFAQMLKSKQQASPATTPWGKPQLNTRQPEIPQPQSIQGSDEEDGPALVAPSLKEMFSAATLSLHQNSEVKPKDDTRRSDRTGKGSNSKVDSDENKA